MSSKVPKFKNERIKDVNLKKYIKAIYSDNIFEFWVLLYVMFMLVTWFLLSNTYSMIWENRTTYFPLFLFNGIQVFLMAILNVFEVFKKFLFYFIIKTIFLYIFAFLIVINLAYGGLSKLILFELLDKTFLIFLLASLSTKFVSIAILFYSIWMCFFLFIPKHFYANSQKKTVLNKWILPVSFYVVLFYPAIYYYVFGSKILLRL